MSLFHEGQIPALDSNGRVIVGAKWYFYLTGTTTPTNVYSNSTLATSLGSNVTSTSGGRFVNIYLDDSKVYRAVLKDALGATIRDIDPANGSESTNIAELARDTIGAALIAGENIAITVNDASDTITISSTTGGSTTVTPASDGVFFNSATGDLFTAMSNASDASLTVSGSSLAFNSATAKTLDCVVKDSGGNTGKFCFDTMTIDATYTINSFVAADQEAVFTGMVNDSLGLYASAIKSHPGSAAQAFGALYNAGSQLTTDAAGGFAFGGPISVRSQYTRAGDAATHTLTYPATADHTMTISQVFAATSYETPRLFGTAGVRFKQGNLSLTSLKVSAAYPNATYAFVGDSLTQGRMATAYTDGFARKVRTLYPDEVLICGAPSATTANWLDATQPVIDMAPRYVFICLGTNDLNLGVSLATAQANYTTIVNRFIAAGITPVVISLPPFNNTNIPTMNSWLSAQGWIYVDIYSLLVGTGTSLNATYDSGDGIHWNTAGHNVVYGAIVSAISTHNLTAPANTFLVDTDGTLAANSDSRVASQKASVTYTAAQRGSGTSALGYGTGAGGTVTQLTSKSTGVTLSKMTGQITLNNAALASATTVSFTLTNTNIAAGDVLILNHVSGGTAGAYTLNAQCGAGSASINVRNVTGGSLSEAAVIGFALIKAVTA